MREIYVDPKSFKCHTSNPDGIFLEVDLSPNAQDFFAPKCTAFIEGYRLKPDGETWVREDGEVFFGGEMITPWKPYSELDAAQRQYERELLRQLQENSVSIDELEAAYQEGVNSV